MDIQRGFLDWHILATSFFLTYFHFYHRQLSKSTFLWWCGSTLLLSYFSQFYDHVETLLWSCTTFYQGKNWTCSLAALDPALSFQKLILHCITAIYKSLKCLAVITAKNEADNRVDSTARLCKMYNRGQLRIEQNYMKTKWNCPLH